jgi:hypothetical protein
VTGAAAAANHRRRKPTETRRRRRRRRRLWLPVRPRPRRRSLRRRRRGNGEFVILFIRFHLPRPSACLIILQSTAFVRLRVAKLINVHPLYPFLPKTGWAPYHIAPAVMWRPALCAVLVADSEQYLCPHSPCSRRHMAGPRYALGQRCVTYTIRVVR